MYDAWCLMASLAQVISRLSTSCRIFFLLFSCRACKKTPDKDVSIGPQTCAS